MKIWDIYDHLQLVSSIFIKTSSNKSILKKQVKPGFTNYLPKVGHDFHKVIVTQQAGQLIIPGCQIKDKDFVFPQIPSGLL